jgi:early secretory antigenic target protein ESAT-6
MIKVNYAALETAHTQMQSISRHIDQKLETLRSGLQKLEWQGQDAQAYQQQQAAWDQAVTDINAILNEIGAAVGIARENYITTEENNVKVW